MGTHIVMEGNAFYEVDEECTRRKEYSAGEKRDFPEPDLREESRMSKLTSGKGNRGKDCREKS